MADINPAEVSAILKNQLEGYNSSSIVDEVGTVLEVGDGIARVFGLSNAQYGELVSFEEGLEGMVLNLEEDHVGVVLLGPSKGVKEGDTVKRTQRIASINVGDGVVGRVLNTLGNPIDGKGNIEGQLFEMPLERKAPGVVFRQPVNEPLQTGIKSIDAMIPVGRGQRELIIGDRQTGKTTVCIDTILNQKEFYDAGEPVYCVYVAIGQKASSVAAVCTSIEERGASDYTKHGEKARMERYLERHGGGTPTSTKEDWKDPTTAGSLSRWILWNKADLKASFNDYKRRFNLKGELKVKRS